MPIMASTQDSAQKECKVLEETMKAPARMGERRNGERERESRGRREKERGREIQGQARQEVQVDVCGLKIVADLLQCFCD